MNCLLRRLWVVALMGLVLLFATRAGAQPVVDMPRIEVSTPPPPGELPAKPPSEQSAKPPEGPNERSAVATVRVGREDDPALGRVVAYHLRRRGLPTIDTAAAEAAAACTSPECLESLVRHENVGFLFTAQVDERGPDAQFITMTLFDVVRRAELQETATCSPCNKTLLGYKLNEVADELISRCRDARQGHTVPNQILNTAIALPTPAPVSALPLAPAPAPDSAAAPAPILAPAPERPPVETRPPPVVIRRPPPPRGFFAKLPQSRRILTGVLGGLAGAALVASIVLTATDGLDTPLGCDLRTDVLQDKCVLKNKPLYATGYALTGALAIGLGFTLFWPTKSAPVSAPSAPEVH